MKDRLTKRTVDALKPPSAGQTKLYDESLAGFGVIVGVSGKKSFFLEYGPKQKRRRITLGAYGQLTPDSARELAKAKLAEIAKGQDPLDERDARRAMPSFGTWAAEYLQGVRLRKKQPRDDERFLAPRDEPRKHGRQKAEGTPKHPAAAIFERWSSRPVDQIGRRDVETAMVEMASRGNTSANRWLASIRSCFKHAVDAGTIETNPAMGVKQYREGPPRERVLTDAEFGRVIDLLEGIADPHERLAFVLLLDTGARKSEVLNARWTDLDLDGGCWRIPSPKAGRPQTVPLTAGTVAYLRGVDRLGPWLVPGRDPSRHRGDLRGSWDDLREAAGITDVTIHDLRRTFGLRMARSAGLHVASKLLRHSDIRVTEKVYAPLGLDELRAAATVGLRERGQVIDMLRAKGG